MPGRKLRDFLPCPICLGIIYKHLDSRAKKRENNMAHGRKAFGMTKKKAADFHHIKKKKKEELHKLLEQSGAVKHLRVPTLAGFI